MTITPVRVLSRVAGYEATQGIRKSFALTRVAAMSKLLMRRIRVKDENVEVECRVCDGLGSIFTWDEEQGYWEECARCEGRGMTDVQVIIDRL